MRIATFNIGGANVPGKRSAEHQSRSWHWLAALGVNLAFIQEVEHSAVPDWAEDRWHIVRSESADRDQAGRWGSAVAADPALGLRRRDDLVAADPWLSLLYDYVVVGEIDLPAGPPAIVTSVHAVAKELEPFLRENVPQPPPAVFTADDLARIAQPTDVPWVLDVAFNALARSVHGHRFIVGGDWNNARLFDDGKPGQPVATMFFTRAERHGWFECHELPEERTWLNPAHRPLQLDHLFVDRETASLVESCFASNAWPASELSDHAPLLADLRGLDEQSS